MKTLSKIDLPVSLSFSSLNKLLQDKLIGIEVTQGFKLQDIDLSSEDSHGVLKIILEGVVAIKLRATFLLNVEDDRVLVHNLYVKIESDGILAAGINKLLIKGLKNNLESRLNQLLHRQLNVAKDFILNNPKEIVLYDDIKLHVAPKSVEIVSLNFSEKGLLVNLKGDVNFHILD